jgi:hypothetical protein
MASEPLRREPVREALGDEEAWVVGGAIRDELLGRPVLDLDVACLEPERAAHTYAGRNGGAVFRLSAQHGGWRVALADGRTLDFTPLRGGSIESDLATRDFTIDAIAEPLRGGEPIDPHGGRVDLRAGLIRAVSPDVFDEDPLRLLRAVRLEDELGFRVEPETERLMRARASLAGRPAGERLLDELSRLSAAGYERLAELGLLAALEGRADPRIGRFDSAWFRLAVAFGPGLKRLPISNELRRFLDTLLRAEPPEDASPRAIHRFRRATEPWALEALAFVGAEQHVAAVLDARRREPTQPLLRGDELGLLELIAEERVAGTISTREEALELVRRSVE